MDELDRIEARIDHLRQLLFAERKGGELIVDSPLHRELDELVARHARISLARYRARISRSGTKTSK